MPTVYLGVTDVPYSFTDDVGKVKKGKNKGKKYASTTGDVAEILETKYGVMAAFWSRHGEEAVASLSASLQDEFEAALQGKDFSSGSAFTGGAAEVEDMFQKFLDLKEMDTMGVAGVPTAASLAGVSHRFKKPYAKRASRPSFIDTGLYENSFRCWVD